MKLENVTAIVKMLLEREPETRNDDDLLWVKVLEIVAQDKGMPDYSKTMPFRDFLFLAQCSGLPHFKSVSRARRRLQSLYPELRATKETEEARAELEAGYREYSRHGFV